MSKALLESSVEKEASSPAKHRRLPRRCRLLLLLPLSLLLTECAKRNPAFSEQYFSLGLYKWLSQSISAFTGLLPFSLLELGIVLLIALAIIKLGLLIHHLYHKTARPSVLIGKALLNLLCVASVALFSFTLLSGINYYRRPFSFYSGLVLRPATVEELQGLCTLLATEANSLRAQLPEDESGHVVVFPDGFFPVARSAKHALEQLAEQYPVLSGRYPAPKPVFLSRLMSRTQITGVYSPFTMEANVNVDVPDYTIPATMCHELSHLRGFMREDEANFIAYLACRASDEPSVRYSGTMLALVYAGNQLYGADKELYFALQQTYSPAVQQDLQTDNTYWQQFEDTLISEVSTTVNDTYLKLNSQSDGVKSYGRMVDLLLADYRLQVSA